jgi:NAD(P)-dependent dehydrogenase (short-subunit alcohol dehydrogenase family)
MSEQKTVVVIDGQGGKMGAAIVAALKAQTGHFVLAVGANTAATSAMLRAGADAGATGENPVCVACRTADFILGPLGLVIADALHGEITPSMARAVGQSSARRVLIPVSRCNTEVAGVQPLALSEYVRLAVEATLEGKD